MQCYEHPSKELYLWGSKQELGVSVSVAQPLAGGTHSFPSCYRCSGPTLSLPSWFNEALADSWRFQVAKILMIPIQCHSPTENRKLSHRVWRDVRLGKVVKWSESHSVVSDSLRPHRLHSPWNSPGQNTGVGSLSLLQRIFPTQGWNPDLSHCRRILYQLSHKGSPIKSSTNKNK